MRGEPMELSGEEMLQLLDVLQVSETMKVSCRDLLAQDDYTGMYQSLRGVRKEFLEDLHICQKRLDQLDHLLYEVKRKTKVKNTFEKEGEEA